MGGNEFDTIVRNKKEYKIIKRYHDFNCEEIYA